MYTERKHYKTKYRGFRLLCKRKKPHGKKAEGGLEHKEDESHTDKEQNQRQPAPQGGKGLIGT